MLEEQEEPAEPDVDAARMVASNIADAGVNGAEPEDENSVTFRSGLQLGVHEVPPLIIRRPLQELPEPQPPMIPMPDKGEHIQEPNPNDPDYIREHEEWQLTIGLSVMDTMLILGTTEPDEEGEAVPLIINLPEKMFHPDHNGWINWLSAGGVEIDERTKHTRYLCWLRYYAVANTADLGKLLSAIAGKPLNVYW